MKEVILKNDLIQHLNDEIIRLRKTPAENLLPGKDGNYSQGYKEGLIVANMRIVTRLWSTKTKL